ncbi:MAG: hypothetical protein ACI88A_000648 [Paraglaciecola sp.]|jgi:hypothetical protein
MYPEPRLVFEIGMSEIFTCWKCGESLTDVILPMSRREECVGCGADQHVCKMCVFFDSKNSGSCNEEKAEPPSDTEHANFCDYFKPSTDAFSAASEKKSEQAKANFAALFGDTDNTQDNSELDTEDAGEKVDTKKLSPGEIAEQKLRDLLGG